MTSCKQYSNNAVKLQTIASERKVRKHTNPDNLLALVREDFKKVSDTRADKTKISLDDALMSALAMFLLKDPSLLAFDNRRSKIPENLHAIFGIKNIPFDSLMRSLLDPIELCRLRAPVSIHLKTWHLRTVWARNPKTVPFSIISKCLQRPLFIQTVRLLFQYVRRLSVRGTVPTKTIVNVTQLLGFLMNFVGNTHI
jgi:hypothetical protein